jgi:uncharacterized protein (TIGR03083 family)
VKRVIDTDRFPEWQPFVDAVQQRRPDTGTWCEAWTVRDIVIHQAGNAEELARVLGAHLEGEPVGTRGFEEREAPLRTLSDADLREALVDRMAALNRVAAAADDVPADTDVAWTGRTMKVPWFAEHMREELVLHGWDITGDCDFSAAFQTALAEPWMTTHSIIAVGRPLLAKGAKHLGITAVGTQTGGPLADLQPRRTRSARPGASAAQRLLSRSVVVADRRDPLDDSGVFRR